MAHTIKLKQRSDFRVEPLGKGHDRAAFSSGIDALDNYLKKQASQDISKRVAVCFVLTPDGKTVAGFYTLSQYSVDLVSLPLEIADKVPRYPEVPATSSDGWQSAKSSRGRSWESSCCWVNSIVP